MATAMPQVLGTEVQIECQAVVQALLDGMDSLQFVCLGTVDGRVWAFARRGELPLSHRIAAITSSLLALSESFAKEALRSRSLYNVVAAEHGSIVTVRVPCSTGRFALSLGADSGETVALALRKALDGADEIAGLLA